MRGVFAIFLSFRGVFCISEIRLNIQEYLKLTRAMFSQPRWLVPNSRIISICWRRLMLAQGLSVDCSKIERAFKPQRKRHERQQG